MILASLQGCHTCLSFDLSFLVCEIGVKPTGRHEAEVWEGLFHVAEASAGMLAQQGGIQLSPRVLSSSRKLV